MHVKAVVAGEIFFFGYVRLSKKDEVAVVTDFKEDVQKIALTAEIFTKIKIFFASLGGYCLRCVCRDTDAVLNRSIF